MNDSPRDAPGEPSVGQVKRKAEDSRREYMTGKILVALGVAAMISGMGAGVGYAMGWVTIEIVIFSFAGTAILAGAWYGLKEGHWRFARFVPVGLLLLAGIYGTYMRGGSATSTILYVEAIVLSVVLLEAGAQAAVVAIAVVMSIGLSLLHETGVLAVAAEGPYTFSTQLVLVIPSFIFIAIVLRLLIDRMSVQSMAILRARNDLTQSEAEYHTLFNAIGEGVFIADLGGTVVDVNPAACLQVGMSRDELIGVRLESISAPPAVAGTSVLEHLTAARVLRYETLHRKGDGTLLPVELTLTYAEINGTPRILATARDISARVAGESALRESEEKFRLLFALAPYGFTLTDGEGRIEIASRSIVTSIGRSHDEIVGRTMVELGIIDANAERLMFSLLRDQGRLDKMELQVTDGGGNAVDLLCSAVKLELGGNEHYLAAVLDISERKRAERLLAASEHRYHALFEEAGDAILLMSNTTILDCNAQAEALFQRPREMIVQHSPVELSPPEQPSGVSSALRATELIQAAVAGHRQNFEWVHTRADGSMFFAEVSLIGLRSVGERLLLGIVRDISAQKESAVAMERARRAAEDSSRMKSALLMNLSHEFRTPLTGILGLSELIREETGDEVLRRHIDGIATSGRRLLGTLETILKLAQLSSGDVHVTLTVLHAEHIIDRVLARYRSAAAGKGITLAMEGARQPCVVVADEDALFAILTFLVDNAVKFTREGSVTIRTFPADGSDREYCRIDVTDTGIGIPADQFDVIFEEFRQGSEGSSRRFEGSGLGLTVARKLAGLMAGTITVTSEPGAGSTFSVRLPAGSSDNGGAREPAPAALSVDMPKHGPLDVLIVEDNFINKAVMAEALRPICRTAHARNGKLAIQMARTKQYHAILMDINLGAPPDGIQTTQEIRRLPGYGDVPIIAVTGYTLPGDKERLMEQGLTMYLPKPFERSELQAVVRKALL